MVAAAPAVAGLAGRAPPAATPAGLAGLARAGARQAAAAATAGLARAEARAARRVGILQHDFSNSQLLGDLPAALCLAMTRTLNMC